MGGIGSGGKPKPAEIKELLGNPGHRPIQEVPVFVAGGLAAPKWFSAVEREEWSRIVPELERVGIAKAVHQGSLEGICVLYGAWRKSRKDKHMQQARMSFDAYRKALNEFGLTAASAGRVGFTSGANENKDPAQEFFEPRLVK